MLVSRVYNLGILAHQTSEDDWNETITSVGAPQKHVVSSYGFKTGLSIHPPTPPNKKKGASQYAATLRLAQSWYHTTDINNSMSNISKKTALEVALSEASGKPSS